MNYLLYPHLFCTATALLLSITFTGNGYKVTVGYKVMLKGIEDLVSSGQELSFFHFPEECSLILMNISLWAFEQSCQSDFLAVQEEKENKSQSFENLEIIAELGIGNAADSINIPRLFQKIFKNLEQWSFLFCPYPEVVSMWKSNTKDVDKTLDADHHIVDPFQLLRPLLLHRVVGELHLEDDSLGCIDHPLTSVTWQTRQGEW